MRSKTLPPNPDHRVRARPRAFPPARTARRMTSFRYQTRKSRIEMRMWMRVSEAKRVLAKDRSRHCFWSNCHSQNSVGDRCRFVMMTPASLASLSQEHLCIHNTDALLWLLPLLFPNTTSAASISAFQCMMTKALASKGTVSSIDPPYVQT